MRSQQRAEVSARGESLLLLGGGGSSRFDFPANFFSPVFFSASGNAARPVGPSQVHREEENEGGKEVAPMREKSPGSSSAGHRSRAALTRIEALRSC